MLEKLSTLAQLLKTLQQVPYLASKNLYRVADHFLKMNTQQVQQFCAVLLDAKNKLIQCPDCSCWCQKGQLCIFCSESKRDKKTICVVETWQDILAIERTKAYTGVYHVLGGVICPLDGIGPEDLTIEQLIKRTEKYAVKEIILATNQTPEGEATAFFIARKFKEKPVMISCLARGLPVGSSLGAMDRVTIYKALSERRPF